MFSLPTNPYITGNTFSFFHVIRAPEGLELSIYSLQFELKFWRCDESISCTKSDSNQECCIDWPWCAPMIKEGYFIKPDVVTPNLNCEGDCCITCGDGIITGSETCDDGNQWNKDGCSSSCQIECGWQCPFENKQCIWETCGNNKIGTHEECDHGGNYESETCNFDCTLP